jgi:hypothetical protein
MGHQVDPTNKNASVEKDTWRQAEPLVGKSIQAVAPPTDMGTAAAEQRLRTTVEQRRGDKGIEWHMALYSLVN